MNIYKTSANSQANVQWINLNVNVRPKLTTVQKLLPKVNRCMDAVHRQQHRNYTQHLHFPHLRSAFHLLPMSFAERECEYCGEENILESLQRTDVCLSLDNETVCLDQSQ